MKNYVAVVALALSLVSLGFQVHTAKPALFDRFMAPARISEFDYRLMRANEGLARTAIPNRNGMSPPFIHRLSDDHTHLTVRVIVNEDSLNAIYKVRKDELYEVALDAYCSVASEFNMDLESEATKRAISVEFMSIQQLASNTGKPKPYAEFTNGELILR